MKVASKRGPEGRKSEHLSTGFRLAEFRRAEFAVNVVKVAQNTLLDGRVLGGHKRLKCNYSEKKYILFVVT